MVMAEVAGVRHAVTDFPGKRKLQFILDFLLFFVFRFSWKQNTIEHSFTKSKFGVPSIPSHPISNHSEQLRFSLQFPQNCFQVRFVFVLHGFSAFLSIFKPLTLIQRKLDAFLAENQIFGYPFWSQLMGF